MQLKSRYLHQTAVSQPHPVLFFTLPCLGSLPLFLSFSSDTSFLGQQTLFMFYICTVASTMQFLPLGISTKQVLKGVLHFCLYIWLCVECGSELGLATTIFSVYRQAREKQVHGRFRSWVRSAAGWLHGVLEGPLTWHELRRNFGTKGRLDDWVLAKLVTAEQCKHLAGSSQPQ